MARPSEYTTEIGTEICRRIAEGESVRSIVKDDDMPASSTVYKWLLDPEHKAFSEQYATARSIQAEHMFEELLEIADDSSNDSITKGDEDGEGYEVPNHEYIQRSRLRVDTRKWYLSKVLPKKFGDKTDITSGGQPIAQIAGFNFVKNGDDNTNNQADA